MSNDIRKAAEHVRAWLADDQMSQWRYMESGDFYADLGEKIALLDAALAAEQPQPEAQPPRFPTMLRKMWSGGEVQAWIDQHWAAPPPAAPTPEPSDAVAEFARGIDAAARFVEKRLADYDAAHGSTDSDTGAREYPGTGDEYVCELAEIAEAIRGLAPPPAAPEPSEAVLRAMEVAFFGDSAPPYEPGDPTLREVWEPVWRAAAAARRA